MNSKRDLIEAGNYQKTVPVIDHKKIAKEFEEPEDRQPYDIPTKFRQKSIDKKLKNTKKKNQEVLF